MKSNKMISNDPSTLSPAIEYINNDNIVNPHRLLLSGTCSCRARSPPLPWNTLAAHPARRQHCCESKLSCVFGGLRTGTDGRPCSCPSAASSAPNSSAPFSPRAQGALLRSAAFGCSVTGPRREESVEGGGQLRSSWQKQGRRSRVNSTRS